MTSFKLFGYSITIGKHQPVTEVEIPKKMFDLLQVLAREPHSLKSFVECPSHYIIDWSNEHRQHTINRVINDLSEKREASKELKKFIGFKPVLKVSE